jgi:hypothetical protein
VLRIADLRENARRKEEEGRLVLGLFVRKQAFSTEKW